MAVSPDQIGNIPYFIAKLEKASETAEVVQTALTGPGETVTIPAGSTLAEALQIILDEIDPAG
jgi:hypothetical protein